MSPLSSCRAPISSSVLLGADLPAQVITLTCGTQTVVDQSDAHLLRSLTGVFLSKGYVSLKRDKRPVLLHRLLMQATPEQCVDHINGNPLDNRRCNLRIATRAENSQNRGPQKNSTTGAKGVRMSRTGRRYRAEVVAFGKRYGLGTFGTLEEAAEAYAKKAREVHGAFFCSRYLGGSAVHAAESAFYLP